MDKLPTSTWADVVRPSWGVPFMINRTDYYIPIYNLVTLTPFEELIPKHTCHLLLQMLSIWKSSACFPDMECLLRWTTDFGIILDERKSNNESDKLAIGMLNSGGLWCFGRKEKYCLVILVAFCLESKEIQDSQCCRR